MDWGVSVRSGDAMKGLIRPLKAAVTAESGTICRSYRLINATGGDGEEDWNEQCH